LAAFLGFVQNGDSCKYQSPGCKLEASIPSINPILDEAIVRIYFQPILLAKAPTNRREYGTYDKKEFARPVCTMRLAIVLLSCVCCVLPEGLFGQDHHDDFQLGSHGTATVPTTNGVVFEATINGKGPYQLIFDTGASVNILNPAIIAQLGLPAAGDVVSVPAFGGPVDAQPFHAGEVRIGELTLRDQTFYSIQMPWPDGTGPVGAVGYELMRRLVVTVDYQQHHLTFFDPASFTYPGHGEKIPLEQDGTQLLVSASLGNAQGDFVIDTGDFDALDVNGWFVKKFAILDRVPHRYHEVFERGAGGDEPAQWITRLKTVCIAKSCVHDVIAYLSDGQASWDNRAGTIGADTLKQFVVTVDWPHRALYLETNAERTKPEVFNRSGILADFDESGKDLKVAIVLPGSPGDKAGVKVGDRILTINDHPVIPVWGGDEPAFLKDAGTEVSLTIQRGGSVQQVRIRLKNLL
jgi:hypothetical protein